LPAIIILSTMTAASLYVKKFKWSVVKNRKIFYNPPKK
jgi:ubiquinol-cytochrome c reductase cytochrome c1 subunit